MGQTDVATRAKQLDLRSVPAIVVAGTLFDGCCCRGRDGAEALHEEAREDQAIPDFPDRPDGVPPGKP